MIEDWKKSWRFLSVQANVLFSTMLIVWLSLPLDQQAAIASLLPGFGGNGPAVLALAGFALSTVARLKAQPKLHE